METITVASWNEFKESIEELRRRYKPSERKLKNGRIYRRHNRILFRGQACASWPLKTTLERAVASKLTVPRYILLATSGVNEIESYSGHRWNLSSYPELKAEAERHQDSFRMHLPAYNYLVYLRHHGFPSPLLDWSESPFVAAFFAFESPQSSTEVAVYCYVESPQGVKGGWSGQPIISVQGPYVSTDKRHFSQRAWYTVATLWDYGIKQHHFAPHEDVFANSPKDQDVLIKIVLPGSLRTTILRELADYNINHFSLFHSEDALVRTIAMRAFDLNIEAPELQ